MSLTRVQRCSSLGYSVSAVINIVTGVLNYGSNLYIVITTNPTI